MRLNFCVLCGSTDNLEHHHVVPKSLGGSDNEDNLLTLCAKHHMQLHNISSNRIHSSELIRVAKAKNRDAGLFLGGHVPFGYTIKSGKMVENSREQRIIAEMRDLRSKGVSLRKLADWLYDKHKIKKSHSTIALLIESVSSRIG